MKKRIFSAFLACILVICSLSVFVSCSSEPTDIEGLKERFVYLIEESKELNVIFFGNGLPVYRSDGLLSERKRVYFNESLGNYERLMENSSYISVDHIKIAAEEIYSVDYLSEVYESAFDGIMTGETSAYVRFYDDGEYLYQHIDFYDFTLFERIYDYSTMKVVEPYSSDYVNVTIESYTLDDKTRREVELSFIFENGNWYLDSPTY